MDDLDEVKASLLMLQGVVSQLPQEDQDTVYAVRDMFKEQFKTVMEQEGFLGASMGASIWYAEMGLEQLGD